MQDRVYIRSKSGPQPPAESSAQRFWENSTEEDFEEAEKTLGACSFCAPFSEIPHCERERGDLRLCLVTPDGPERGTLTERG